MEPVSMRKASSAPDASDSSYYADVVAAVDERTLRIAGARNTSTLRRRAWLVTRVLVLADLAGLSLAFLLTQSLYAQAKTGEFATQTEFVLFVAALPGWLLLSRLYGLYGREADRTDHSIVDDLVAVFHMITVGAWVVFAAVALSGMLRTGIAKWVVFWALAIVLVTFARALGRAFCRSRRAYVQNALIVGAGDVGQLVAKKFVTNSEWGINLVGFVDASPKQLDRSLEHIPLLGRTDQMPAIVRLFDVERVVIAFSGESHTQTLRLIRALKDLEVRVDIVPRLFEIVGPSVDFQSLEGLPVVGLPPLRFGRSARALKRGLDSVGSTVGLILLAPVLLYIALRIKLDSPGPALYRHVRVGRNGALFGLYKFRTMHVEYCRGAKYGGDAAEAEFQKLMSDPTRQAEFASTYKLQDDPRVHVWAPAQTDVAGRAPPADQRRARRSQPRWATADRQGRDGSLRV